MDLSFPLNGTLESIGDDALLSVRIPKGYLNECLTRKADIVISADELRKLVAQALNKASSETEHTIDQGTF